MGQSKARGVAGSRVACGGQGHEKVRGKERGSRMGWADRTDRWKKQGETGGREERQMEKGAMEGQRAG